MVFSFYTSFYKLVHFLLKFVSAEQTCMCSNLMGVEMQLFPPSDRLEETLRGRIVEEYSSYILLNRLESTTLTISYDWSSAGLGFQRGNTKILFAPKDERSAF